MFEENDDFIPQLNCHEESYHSFTKINVNPCDLNILYLNARSLVKKLDDLINIVSLLKTIDLVVISESWLKDDISPYYNIPGHESMHICRKDKRGGISMFVKTEINSTICETNIKESEYMHITAEKNGVVFNIVGVYNHTHSNIKVCLEELKAVMEKDLPNTYILGDFNVDVLQETPTTLQTLSYMDSLGFQICNQLPTRPGATKNSLIDHIYTNTYNLPT